MADVYASAHVEHMQALVQQGLVSKPETLCTNDLVMVVPSANPSSLATFDDLLRAERLVVGSRAVPVGRYTEAMFVKAETVFGRSWVRGVQRHIVSREANVRLVRSKVVLGEADAALVYRSDALGVPELEMIELPEAVQVRARYEIAAVSGAGPTASRFIEFVRSPEAHDALRTHGFGAPS